MSRRRYVRRRRRSHFRRTLVIAVAAIALLEAVFLTRHQTQPVEPVLTASLERNSPPITQSAVFRDLTRPVYPLSVIRGGAYTAEEANAAIDRDAVVANHYAVFQRGQLNTVPSPFTKPVYVSYRRGNDIYWTRRPVALHERETLLTDGVFYARARCGNRISLTAQLPVAEEEPASDVLDDPESDDTLPPALLDSALPLDPVSLASAPGSAPGGGVPSSAAILNSYLNTFWPRMSGVLPTATNAGLLYSTPQAFFPIEQQLPILFPTPSSSLLTPSFILPTPFDAACTAQAPPPTGFQEEGHLSPGIAGTSVLVIGPCRSRLPQSTGPAVPEPTTLATFAAGIALLGLIARRRAISRP